MARPQKSVHYVCPRNGELTRCPVENYPFPHRVEALLREGSKVPSCETHHVRLVRSN